MKLNTEWLNVSERKSIFFGYTLWKNFGIMPEYPDTFDRESQLSENFESQS